MRVRAGLKSAVIKTLYESLGVQMLETVCRLLYPGYDIYARTGCPENIPLTAQHIARQLVTDAIADDQFLELVELMISLEINGQMGRTFPMNGIRQIIKNIIDEGFIFDTDKRCFLENPNGTNCRSRGWGRLKEGHIYQVTLLKVDIVNNSGHVRNNQRSLITQVYNKLKMTIDTCTSKRNGRQWFWEGDGGLLAFYYGEAFQDAVLSSMEILQKWFMFNHTENPLQEPLYVRLAVYSDSLNYSASDEIIKRNDAVKKVFEMESSYTPKNALCITKNSARHLDRIILDNFCRLPRTGSWDLLCYQISMEDK